MNTLITPWNKMCMDTSKNFVETTQILASLCSQTTEI